jgi:hypothetical protein
MKELSVFVVIVGLISLGFFNGFYTEPNACFTSTIEPNDRWCHLHELEVFGGTITFLSCDEEKGLWGSKAIKRCYVPPIPE